MSESVKVKVEGDVWACGRGGERKRGAECSWVGARGCKSAREGAGELWRCLCVGRREEEWEEEGARVSECVSVCVCVCVCLQVCVWGSWRGDGEREGEGASVWDDVRRCPRLGEGDNMYTGVQGCGKV